MNLLIPIVTVLGLAFAIEALVEYFIGLPMKRYFPNWSWLLIYVAWLVAAAGVWTYKIDLMQLWLGISEGWTWFGLIISAAMIGRGSNWLHEFATRYLSKKEEA